MQIPTFLNSVLLPIVYDDVTVCQHPCRTGIRRLLPGAIAAEKVTKLHLEVARRVQNDAIGGVSVKVGGDEDDVERKYYYRPEMLQSNRR